ncbi:MAG: WbqC family protein [Prevotellaceae bacterium]|nr:WbqC family protein [Prevotellaceae bacterium]
MILPIAYFGSVGYFKLLNSVTDVQFEQHENYQKQTFRTRCEIGTSQGRQILSIPVEGSHGQKCLIKDVRISDHGKWRHQHWNAIVSAYGDSPFFEYYQDDILPFFEKKWDFLFDFNMEITYKLCELLDIHPTIGLTDNFCGITNDLTFPQVGKPYYQVHQQKTGFLPNLSVLDLLFNMGNESCLYL